MLMMKQEGNEAFQLFPVLDTFTPTSKQGLVQLVSCTGFKMNS